MTTTARSAALKQEIESHLSSRIPAALSPQTIQAPRLLPVANKLVNSMLGGGLPVGGICEFSGSSSGGRTTLAMSVLSEACVDSACAYVDVSDSLDARSAAASGVMLKNLLWVRFSESHEPIQRLNSPELVDRSANAVQDRPHGGTQHSGGRHPRTETKGLDKALAAMLSSKAEARHKKMEGTPGFPNNRLCLADAPKEQIAFDHFNARRADASDPLRQMDRMAADEAREHASAALAGRTEVKREQKPWSKLDKALRATDQIFLAGGFRVVVLDLASILPEQAFRIPSATWYRFSRAAQEGDAILLLLTQQPCARSSAKCVLDCSTQLGIREAGNVLSCMSYSVEVVRQRMANPYAKKAPGRAVAWEAAAPWMHSVGTLRSTGR